MFILNSFYYLFVYKLGIKYIRELVVQLEICICNKYIEAIRFSDSQDSVNHFILQAAYTNRQHRELQKTSENLVVKHQVN